MTSIVQAPGGAEELPPLMGEDDTPEAPRRIGRYEIRRELGRGMMGVVYEADDPVLGRTIALKTIELAFAVSPADRDGFEKRFFAEARTAARLSHPGIVVVHDVGRDAETGVLFIALEYLPGRTLADIVKEGSAMPWREALRITARLAEALHHAHAKGVIHRDIKPANLMLLPSGEPKIMDFGIAKIETARLQLTSAGQSFGTPLYMSPEMALGRKIDPRSDLFSLGAVAYTLLTSRLAFHAENIPRMISRVIQEDPPPPGSIVPGLPRDVDDIVARALAKAPTDRYPDGRTLSEDIEDVLAGRPPRHRRALDTMKRTEGTMVSQGPPKETTEPDLDAIFAKLTHPPGSQASTPAAPVSLGAAPAAPARLGTAPGSELDSQLAMLVPGPAGPAEVVSTRPAPAAPARPRTNAPPSPRPAPASGSKRGLSGRLPYGIAGVIIVGLLVVVAIQYGARRGDTPGASPVAPASPVEPLAPWPSAATSPAIPAPPVETPAAAPDATPSAPSSEAPQPSERIPPATSARSAPMVTPSRLFIDFEHPLRTGTLRVRLDGDLVLDEDLSGHVTRQFAGIKLRRGGLEKLIEVAPGRRDVQVQVQWDDNTRSESISGTFKAGSMKRLEVRVGLVRKNLSLEWK